MEEQKELNLVEVLKDCPKGTKLYSTIYGEVEFESIDYGVGVIYPISFYKDGNIQCVTKEGLHLAEHSGECSLFPSRDNRDWSTFKVLKPKWNPDTLQPFDKVLVRDDETKKWLGDFFLYKGDTMYMTIGGIGYRKIIPFNDDTRKMLGTSIEEPEYYRQ